jgi:hypothetical protein
MLKLPHSSFLIIGLLLLSCSPKTLPLKGEKVKRMKTSALVESLDSLSNIKMDFFYGKMSTKYKDTIRSVSFKTSIRMRCDSALSAMITYASIPVANAFLSKDSLIIANKREKCYSESDINGLRENFGIDFSFKNVQELLLGSPLDWDSTRKYFQIHEPYRYVVSSHRKRYIRRLDRKEDAGRDIVVKYFLSGDRRRLEGLEIMSMSDTAKVIVSYLEREENNGYNLPIEMTMEVFLPRNHIEIEFSYIKSEVNEPQPLYFTIPESYVECP